MNTVLAFCIVSKIHKVIKLPASFYQRNEFVSTAKKQEFENNIKRLLNFINTIVEEFLVSIKNIVYAEGLVVSVHSGSFAIKQIESL